MFPNFLFYSIFLAYFFTFRTLCEISAIILNFIQKCGIIIHKQKNQTEQKEEPAFKRPLPFRFRIPNCDTTKTTQNRTKRIPDRILPHEKEKVAYEQNLY